MRDASSPDNTGHIGAIVSVLFEDGSIVLLKFKIKNFTESLLRDVVQFKEGSPVISRWLLLSNVFVYVFTHR